MPGSTLKVEDKSPINLKKLIMKITSFINLKLRIASVLPHEYLCESTEDHTQLRIRRTDLDRNKRVPVPSYLYDSESNSLRQNAIVSVIKLNFDTGFVRYALDEKVYGRGREEAVSDPLVADLLRDMAEGESQCLEFKSSVLYTPNPEDGRDRAFQMRELVKQVVAGANSSDHRLRIYVGIAYDRRVKKYHVVGLNDEVEWFGSQELLQASFLNMVKQLTTDGVLMSLKMTWIQCQQRSVLRIDVEHHGDLILYGNRELYVRFGSSVHEIVENASYLKVIRDYSPLRSVPDVKYY